MGVINSEPGHVKMSKIGKSLLGKLTGNNNNCCCGTTCIVSVKNISVDGKDMEIAGMDEEFGKYIAADKTPENGDDEKLFSNLLSMNAIPENEQEKFKAAILREYRTYWQQNKK
ncbi:hypothetical protein [Methanomethylovorans hollandica]|nr:hypothetical protein [Methanomethylovorans hollandica]